MEIRLLPFNTAFIDSGNFRQRVISAAVLVPAVILMVALGGWTYILMVTVVVALGLREWLRLVDPNAKKIVLAFAYASLLVIMGVGAVLSPAFGVMTGAFLTLVFFIGAARNHGERAGLVSLGIPYMAGSGLALLDVRIGDGGNVGRAIYLLVVVWGTDIGAYLAGRTIGGPKLAPDISPNKTWAGLCGGMVLASVFGYAAALAFGAREPSVGFGLALLLACVSQLGDLFKSHFKRRAGVKESGGLIPGHGGVLDRIDGLVFAAVFFVLFQIALGARINWW
jgi:phosphatidate cytidylyltransferase